MKIKALLINHFDEGSVQQFSQPNQVVCCARANIAHTLTSHTLVIWVKRMAKLCLHPY